MIAPVAALDLSDSAPWWTNQSVTVRVTHRQPRSTLGTAVANNLPNAVNLQVEQVRHRTLSPSVSSEHDSARDDLPLGHADSEDADDLHLAWGRRANPYPIPFCNESLRLALIYELKEGISGLCAFDLC